MNRHKMFKMCPEFKDEGVASNPKQANFNHNQLELEHQPI